MGYYGYLKRKEKTKQENSVGNPLRYKAYGKVNLGLEVLGLRPDGYHEILTVLQTVSLADELIFESDRRLSVVSDHPAVPQNERNLVIRVGRAIQKRYGIRKGARITIRKCLPVGGGMGGGSSDAACALVGLSDLWNLDPEKEELETLASNLGSDVPFFLKGGTCLGKGRGEIIEILPALPNSTLMVALPGFGISTAWAYKKLREPPGGLTNSGEYIKIIVSALKSGDIQRVVRSLYNRFEEVVFPRYPELADIKEDFLRSGAWGALLSGSGSTVFGLFGEEREDESLGPRRDSLLRNLNLTLKAVHPTHQGWERIGVGLDIRGR